MKVEVGLANQFGRGCCAHAERCREVDVYEVTLRIFDINIVGQTIDEHLPPVAFLLQALFSLSGTHEVSYTSAEPPPMGLHRLVNIVNRTPLKGMVGELLIVP